MKKFAKETWDNENRKNSIEEIKYLLETIVQRSEYRIVIMNKLLLTTTNQQLGGQHYF